MTHALALLSMPALMASLAPAAEDVPAELLKLAQMREALPPLRVTFQQTRSLLGREPTLTHSFRVARNGDMITEQRGDRDGWTMFDSAGSGTSKLPEIRLLNSDGAFLTLGGGAGAVSWEKRPFRPGTSQSIKDVRWLGVSVAPNSMTPGVGLRGAANDEAHPPKAWRVRTVSDDQLVVSADSQTEGFVTDWVLNPRRGWNAERITFRNGDEVLQETRIRLRDWDAVGWFPEKVEYLVWGKPTLIIEVSSIDTATESSFSLRDINCEAGVHITPQNFTHPDQGLRWNGDEIVSGDTWYKQLKAGERQWGPTFQRLNRGEPYSDPYDTPADVARRKALTQSLLQTVKLTSHESLWEAYVREFIKRFELNETQTDAANQLLQRCQDDANSYLTRRKSDVEAVTGEMQALRKPDAATDEPTKKRLAALDEELTKLMQPVDEIFEKKLKPGLEKLPTRAQRAKAQQAQKAASQPSRP